MTTIITTTIFLIIMSILVFQPGVEKYEVTYYLPPVEKTEDSNGRTEQEITEKLQIELDGTENCWKNESQTPCENLVMYEELKEQSEKYNEEKKNIKKEKENVK